jgi:ABC-type transport system substrate-binding protein
VFRVAIASYTAVVAVAAVVGACGTPAAVKPVEQIDNEIPATKIARIALRAPVASLDPVAASSQYARAAQAQIYEPLFTYEYGVSPNVAVPLLAKSMPTVSSDGLTYTIELREDVRFHDDECFAQTDGKGRPMVAQDVVYSLMRHADRELDPRGWWVFEGRIAGFDAFRQRMQEREPGGSFDWDAAISGLVAVDDHTVRITLVRPFPQILFVLAMGYSAVVPRECAEFYGIEFRSYPVGTGPFVLRSWTRGETIELDAHRGYWDEGYPLVDSLEIRIHEEDEPLWSSFHEGGLDLIQVPAQYHAEVFDGDNALREKFVNRGVHSEALPLLDYVYRGFNMEDEVLGHTGGDSARYLRQAISLAIDFEVINRDFYNNNALLYDGPIPPGLDGHDKTLVSPYRGPDLVRARALLVKAGYRDGAGLPVLEFHVSHSGSAQAQADFFAGQLKQIGVQLDVRIGTFPELSDKLRRKQAQMFGLAWGADYPDAENFLQLFYGPNGAPGWNSFNYDNPEYDALYERASVMFPSAERTALYTQMRDILIEDMPAFGSMARVRYYLWNDRLKNVIPAETWYGWYKYLDVEPDGTGS